MAITYGRIETSKNNPKNAVLADLDRRINELKARRDKISSKCQHHFVPEQNIVTKLEKTCVNGVYYAGSIGELNPVSEIRFFLYCTKCGARENVSLSDRCPVCADKVSGKWEEGVIALEKYFGHSDFSYNGPWLISCISCDFKAVGLRWDQ